jgi:hypothetical protein
MPVPGDHQEYVVRPDGASMNGSDDVQDVGPAPEGKVILRLRRCDPDETRISERDALRCQR